MGRILKEEAAERKLQELRDKNLIILECIVGSQAYGTNLPESDIDKVFVYIEPLESILKDEHTIQLNVTKDYKGYEIGRFAELIATGNPNMLDLLHMPEDCIISMSPLFKDYFVDNWKKFLTKQVKTAFGSYAASQIEKANGENKKIKNPQPEKRKSFIEFCWVAENGKSIGVQKFLFDAGIHPKAIGLVSLDHMKGYYAMYVDSKVDELYEVALQATYTSMPWYVQFAHSSKTSKYWPSKYKTTFQNVLMNLQEAHKNEFQFKGIEDKDGVQIVTSNVPKNYGEPIGYMYANKEGFTYHCKEWKEYWDWIRERNELRWKINIESGAEYDTKNMAHCIRLLQMCVEIFRDGDLIVRRPNRDELLEIRAGKLTFDDLLSKSQDLMNQVNKYAKTTTLPDDIDHEFVSNALFEIRQKAYNLSFTQPQI